MGAPQNININISVRIQHSLILLRTSRVLLCFGPSNPSGAFDELLTSCRVAAVVGAAVDVADVVVEVVDVVVVA